jgi:hypothetical protein
VLGLSAGRAARPAIMRTARRSIYATAPYTEITRYLAIHRGVG